MMNNINGTMEIAVKEQEEMRSVTVLLTRYTDLMSRCVCILTRGVYSHASISIDEAEEEYYSFNFKGFVREFPKKKVSSKRSNESVILRFQIPDSSYRIIEDEIAYFQSNRERFSYSRIGVMLCFVHIPHKFSNKYFCSQFIAEVLNKASMVDLKKKESLYFPSQLLEPLKTSKLLTQIEYNAI